jgi:hypothetical protein
VEFEANLHINFIARETTDELTVGSEESGESDDIDI